ncbi:isopenicillin N synthase family oxygenase [Verticiella sediminum]|uniref:2-oxoglutarate-dependent ethylene/succinate-forming enzyme n=1 Tax=Verticiella sediminum TaxID=1247510 RepID=A0A556A6G2_9BURK|nr:2-oxoglutarate and iron-dependent oxygenase domain-containing protein [Verticiella sediminum]TSH88485.1 isopenicillin N synthase family oxygenase [Verticiella sediminum]
MSLSIPVIDLEPALRGSAAERLRTGRLIDQTCRHIGFFTIKGHGVDPVLIRTLRKQAYAFFEQPLAEKQRVAPADAGTPRGYRGLGFDSLARGNALDAPADIKEYYHFGRERWPQTPYYTEGEGRRYFIPNLWPASPAGWAATAERYYLALEKLTGEMMQLAALGLDLPEDFFQDKIDRHITAMRINHYPAQAVAPAPGQLRAGAHTDYGLLTILNGENKPGGLEVLTRGGDWIPVETEPDTFVVNIGDLLMRWTNDRWVSNTHRVINPPEGTAPDARLSVAFFHHPNYDALVECIAPPGLAKYPPVLSGEYRDLKYRQTRV